MAEIREYAVNAKISLAAGHRLKVMAKNRRQSYGEILDALIMAVPLIQTDWQEPLDTLTAQVAELAAQISELKARPVTTSDDTLSPGTELPAPIPDTAPDTAPEAPESPQETPAKRSHSTLTPADLDALKPLLRAFFIKGGIHRSATEISQYLFQEHGIGQTSNGQIIPMTRAAVSLLLNKLELKKTWHSFRPKSKT